MALTLSPTGLMAPVLAVILTFAPPVAAQVQRDAPGITQALQEAKLSMPVAGRVEGVFVREGAIVKTGQLLLHLDRTLEDLEVGRRRLLLQDRVRLESLLAKEVLLRAQVEALVPLARSGAASRKQLEDETLALDAVVAERMALEKSKLREKVELELAQESFERRHLRSPIAGIVTRLGVRLGESVGAHEPVLTVVDVSRLRFVGTVPATEGDRLRAGGGVTLALGTEGRIRRNARLVFVSPSADASSGLVEVIAEFDNRDGSIRPGISGRMLY